jgi:sulfite reductase (NADPH) hemoprotein beta-component
MYQYTDFDLRFVQQRARSSAISWNASRPARSARRAFRPLRLQNGWYVQRYAPMLRVAVPYGEINSAQLRVLATIAREFDHKEAHDTTKANAALARRPAQPAADRATPTSPRARTCSSTGSPCTARRCDGPAGQRQHARHPDQRQLHPQHHQRRCAPASRWTRIADPRPFAEIMRQWSTLHPEFAFCHASSRSPSPAPGRTAPPRLARRGPASGAQHEGALGFRSWWAAAWAARRSLAASSASSCPGTRSSTIWKPWCAPTTALAAATTSTRPASRSWSRPRVRPYIDQVEAEYRDIVEIDGAPHTITQAELDRVSAASCNPSSVATARAPTPRWPTSCAPPPKTTSSLAAGCSSNVAPTRNPDLRAVTCRSSAWAGPRRRHADQLNARPSWPTVQRR